MFFATLEEQHGATIDWKSLYEKTINHDFAEVFIGDIKTPVKHASVELNKMLAHVEEKMMEKFILEEIPPSFQSVFFHRMKEGKDATIEGKLLAFADKLDQFYEAYAELKRGNNDAEFITMYQVALQKLLAIDLPHTVDYFKQHILVDVMKDSNSFNFESLTKQTLKQLHA